MSCLQPAIRVGHLHAEIGVDVVDAAGLGILESAPRPRPAVHRPQPTIAAEAIITTKPRSIRYRAT